MKNVILVFGVVFFLFSCGENNEGVHIGEYISVSNKVEIVTGGDTIKFKINDSLEIYQEN